jgi:hypothetical protein
MKRLASCIALALVPFLSSSAHAALVDIGVTPDQHKLKLDNERFQRQGEAVTAVVRVDFAAPQVVPFSAKSYVAAERIYHFQCANKQYILASGKMFDKDGATVYDYDASKNPFGGAQPQAVPADKSAERLAFDAACAYKKP